VVEDGASEPATFAEKAQKLISTDDVAAVFDGWTSASRKAMLPVFERNKALLYYPVQFAGLESSPYIFYSWATTNSRSSRASKANKEIKAWAKANGMQIVGEDYRPLEHTEYATQINKIKSAKPDAVFNTLNGDSNVAFFKQLKDAGIGPDDIPIMSVSIAEEEVRGIGAKNLAGHLWRGTTTRRRRAPRTSALWPPTRRSSAPTASPRTRSRPATCRSTDRGRLRAGLPVGRVGQEGRQHEPREGRGRRQGPDLRRARGHGHRRR
jgi:ABC-type branched-subunit amino acid transport system substrate-binding protein